MRHNFLFFLLCTFLLLHSAAVSAVGFANLPSQREIIFSPGGQVDVPLTVIRGSNIDVSISSPSPGHPETLGRNDDDNILAYAKLIDAAPHTGERDVTLRFSFPQFMKPGTYYVEVFVTDNPPNAPTATVTAVATAKVRFTVQVLSPEKLLEVRGINVPAATESVPANVTVGVTSRTTQTLDAVRADVRVFKDGVLVATGSTPTISLASGESASMVATLPTEALRGGEYDVNATVHYDGKSAETGTGTLRVGTLHVGVPDSTQSLLYNATNKFTFNISNQWNRELQDVNAFVALGAQTKKTASQNIPPFGKTMYEIYFDRDESVPPGDAIVNVTVNYKDYDQDAAGYITKQESFLLPVQITIPPAEEKPGMTAQTMVIFGLTGLLIILLVSVIFLLLHRRHEETPVSAPTQQPGSAHPAPASATTVSDPADRRVR